MSNISKLEFFVLNISGKGYLSWILDAEIHLDAMDLVDTINDNNQASSQDRAKAMIFIRPHLDEGLKLQYLTIKDPLILWNNLKDRYDHLKLVLLPQARHDWFNLRLLDFKSIIEYNSSMYRIISQLNLCGEDQYREMGFTKYFELLSQFLTTKHHNNLLMKNYENRPVGSMTLPEVNQAIHHQRERGRVADRDRGRNHKINYNHDSCLAPKIDQQYKRKGEKQEVMQMKN
ncbi:hypothetical protein R3W88_027729 [Solanum pinnatisectum]|uniref:Uncharacterized protein n=1 Tax=Solanum pinnatisectum TaxID=50273 RepID=A0AAV9LJC6_9SOLN|nr:hypothetical protein R3W88_027729 [Solanum pinnatisectum]